MITKNENGTVFCQMGKGTLFGGVVRDDENNPRGIAITKTPNSADEGVIILIDSLAGVASYTLPLFDLMEAWFEAGMIQIDDESAVAAFFQQIKEIRETLEPFRPKAAEHAADDGDSQ